MHRASGESGDEEGEVIAMGAAGLTGLWDNFEHFGFYSK